MDVNRAALPCCVLFKDVLLEVDLEGVLEVDCATSVIFELLERARLDHDLRASVTLHPMAQRLETHAILRKN